MSQPQACHVKAPLLRVIAAGLVAFLATPATADVSSALGDLAICTQTTLSPQQMQHEFAAKGWRILNDNSAHETFETDALFLNTLSSNYRPYLAKHAAWAQKTAGETDFGGILMTAPAPSKPARLLIVARPAERGCVLLAGADMFASLRAAYPDAAQQDDNGISRFEAKAARQTINAVRVGPDDHAQHIPSTGTRVVATFVTHFPNAQEANQ